MIALRKPKQWPLDQHATREVLAACPPYDPQRLPAFFKAMGLSEAMNDQASD